MMLQQAINPTGIVGAVQKFFGVMPFVPRGALLSREARDFMVANEESPVVYASGREGGGTYFLLANLRRFELSARDVEIMPMPIWGEAE
ncbi:hypothetical protein [Novosphingobium sp.]|uniref:hypothetical protein n=1 Tax=Novosphingobium sp. TaxID=1874826 RepID=UPI0031D73FE1